MAEEDIVRDGGAPLLDFGEREWGRIDEEKRVSAKETARYLSLSLHARVFNFYHSCFPLVFSF